jgi:NADH-quinone oxidoreductase subunit I
VAWGQATLNPTAVHESKKVALPVWVKPPDPPKPAPAATPTPPTPAPATEARP